jgi:hypothetical protein
VTKEREGVTARLQKPERGGGGLWGRRVSVGELSQLGRIPGGVSNGNWTFEFQMNFEFDETLRNFTRRCRRNLDMGIFPKFF